MLVLVALTLTLLLAAAAGVGVLLNRVVPEVGLGTGMVTGVVAVAVSVRFVLGIFARAHSVSEEVEEAQLEELRLALHRSARGRRPRR